MNSDAPFQISNDLVMLIFGNRWKQLRLVFGKAVVKTLIFLLACGAVVVIAFQSDESRNYAAAISGTAAIILFFFTFECLRAFSTRSISVTTTEVTLELYSGHSVVVPIESCSIMEHVSSADVWEVVVRNEKGKELGRVAGKLDLRMREVLNSLTLQPRRERGQDS